MRILLTTAMLCGCGTDSLPTPVESPNDVSDSGNDLVGAVEVGEDGSPQDGEHIEDLGSRSNIAEAYLAATRDYFAAFCTCESDEVECANREFNEVVSRLDACQAEWTSEEILAWEVEAGCVTPYYLAAAECLMRLDCDESPAQCSRELTEGLLGCPTDESVSAADACPEI